MIVPRIAEENNRKQWDWHQTRRIFWLYLHTKDIHPDHNKLQSSAVCHTWILQESRLKHVKCPTLNKITWTTTGQLTKSIRFAKLLLVVKFISTETSISEQKHTGKIDKTAECLKQVHGFWNHFDWSRREKKNKESIEMWNCFIPLLYQTYRFSDNHTSEWLMMQNCIPFCVILPQRATIASIMQHRRKSKFCLLLCSCICFQVPICRF